MQYEACETAIIGKKHIFILVYTQDAHEVKTTKPFFPFMIPSITSFISKSTTRVVIIVVAVIALIIFLHCKI